jgi:hypothetical protein
MKLKLITIDILVDVSGSVPAWSKAQAWQVNRYFAVRQDPQYEGGRWLVCHMPTGMVAAWAPSRDAAVRVTRRITAVRGVDWDSPDPEFIRVLPRAVRDRVRDAAGLRGPRTERTAR